MFDPAVMQKNAMNIRALHEAIAAVCPIEGVSVGSFDDKSTWRVDFAPDATDVQKSAAADALQKFQVA